MTLRASTSESRSLLAAEFVQAFREQLLAWFDEDARQYPWRGTRDPYAVLVSEAMLQQTQVATVLGRRYYERWLERFPDWGTLAEAAEEELLKAWEGLGYYRRARNLQAAARVVLERHGGEFPRDWSEAIALPGVGPYTAGAVLSIACGLCHPVVDGNVARVLSRIFALTEEVDGPRGAGQLQEWAAELVSPTRPGEFNAALMELGQRVCRPKNPDCGLCPVSTLCQARRDGEPERYPYKKAAAKVTRVTECVILWRRGDQVFLCQESGSRRKGLWRLPQIPEEEAADLAECIAFDYVITRYRVRLRVFEPSAAWERPEGVADGGTWFPSSDPTLWPPLGAPYRRALELAFSKRGNPSAKGRKGPE